jgi:hypothetical protein
MNYVPLNSELIAKKRVNKRMAKKFALSFRNTDNEETDVDKIFETILEKTNEIFTQILALANTMEAAKVRDNAPPAAGTSFASQLMSGVVAAVGGLVNSIRGLNTYIDINMPNLNMFNTSQRNAIMTLVADILLYEERIGARMEALARRNLDGQPHALARPFRVMEPMFQEWQGLLKELVNRLQRASGVLSAVGAGYKKIPRRFL